MPVCNLFDSLSLQEYVALREVMTKAEYQKFHLFPCEEEGLHLDKMERDAKEIFHQLEEGKVRMTQQIKSLKEMFREQMDMCHRPDVEMLQVRGEGSSIETGILFWTMWL